jgi:hypothetical protein
VPAASNKSSRDGCVKDPPFVVGNFENGYDEALTTIKGWFWYVQLKKGF